MAFAGLKRRLPKALLLFSLCCLCFTYGLATGRYKIFPYQVLRNAQTALLALVGASQVSPNAGLKSYKTHVVVPTVRRYAPVIGQELLLVSGGAGYLKNYHQPGCLAWLMDRDGEIKHIWKHDPSLWKNLERVTRVPGVSGEPYPVGMHLYDDGDLLVTYHAANTFPFAIGLARFDVNSKVLWKKELFTHHWFTVTADGRIFVPALRVVDSPTPIARTDIDIRSETGQIYNDIILVLDGDGNVLDEIAMLDALFASGWAGLLARTDSAVGVLDLTADDPLHLNDVRLVGTALAETQSWLSPEDLLVSFRNINAVGILDAAARRFKWLSAGSTIGQHSPRFHDQGVLVLDNLGGDQRLGGTQLVKIDFEQGLPRTVFPRPGVAMPDLCRTLNSGHLDVHRDEQRVLMAITHMSSLWEIDLRTGEVLWEYIYVHPDEDGRRVGINTAKYVYDTTFLARLEK